MKLDVDTVVSLRAEGLTTTQIGEKLGVTKKAVKWFIRTRKLSTYQKPPEDVMPCFKMRGEPKWDFSGDNLNLQYR
jgi:orotate phosphoribosyltransferase-like protein